MIHCRKERNLFYRFFLVLANEFTAQQLHPLALLISSIISFIMCPGFSIFCKFHVARVISVYLVLFCPSSNLAGFFLFSSFVTIFFYCVVLLAPHQTPNLEDQVWVITLDLSGMGGPTSSVHYRQHSSRDHVITQAPPLRQTFGGMYEYLRYIKYCYYVYICCAFVGLDNKLVIFLL